MTLGPSGYAISVHSCSQGMIFYLSSFSDSCTPCRTLLALVITPLLMQARNLVSLSCTSLGEYSLTLNAHAQRGLLYLVCVYVYDYSCTTGNGTDYERYQQPLCNKRSKNKWRFCYNKAVRDRETGTIEDHSALVYVAHQ